MSMESLTGNVIGILAGLACAIIFNALVIWFIANFMVDLGGKSPFKKCITCALGLGLVQMVAYAMIFIPIPLVNFALFIVVWYKGSIAAIEGSLEATKGGFTIFMISSFISAVMSAFLKGIAAS